MVDEQTKLLMWVFTFILVLGFLLTYKNLNGVVLKTPYEGLILSIIGLLGSIYIGVKSSRGGTEAFAAMFV